MAALASRSVIHGVNTKHTPISSSDGSTGLRPRNPSSASAVQVSSQSSPSSRARGQQRHVPRVRSRADARTRTRTLASGSSAESTIPDRASDWVDAQRPHSVADVMTRGDLITATEATTVDQALEFLVDNRITGMPVVDGEGKLVGVVSDYDLLALDTISGKPAEATGMFPQAGSTWKAFKEIQKLLLKTRGRTVGEVMTPSPLVVRPMTNLEDAARLLLESKYRRLPVVDDRGKLVGLLTRGNVVRAALEMKRAEEARVDG